MAATRSTLRGAAPRLARPGEVLAQVNELIVPDMPPLMFVTCLYAILDPTSGRLVYANAGHGSRMKLPSAWARAWHRLPKFPNMVSMTI